MKKVLLIMAMLAVLLMTGCGKNENVEENNVQEIQNNQQQEVVNNDEEILNQSFEERTREAREYMQQADEYGIESLGYISAEHFVSNAALKKEDNHYVMTLTISSSKLFDKEEIENAYKLAQENGSYIFEGYTFYKDNELPLTIEDGFSEETLTYINKEMLPFLKERGFLVKTIDYPIAIFMHTPNDKTKYCIAIQAVAGAEGFMITDIEKEIEVYLLPDDKMLIVPTNIFERNDGIQGKEISVKDFYTKALNNEISSDDLIYGFNYNLSHVGDDAGQYAEYVDAIKFEDGMIKVNFKNGGV